VPPPVLTSALAASDGKVEVSRLVGLAGLDDWRQAPARPGPRAAPLSSRPSRSLGPPGL